MDACRRGHPMVPANTYQRSDGYRECRTCRRLNAREYAREARAALRALRSAK